MWNSEDYPIVLFYFRGRFIWPSLYTPTVCRMVDSVLSNCILYHEYETV